MVTLRRVGGVVVLAAATLSFVPPILGVQDEGWPVVPTLVLQLLTAAAALLLLRIPDHRSDDWWMAGATTFIGLSAIDQEAFHWGYCRRWRA